MSLRFRRSIKILPGVNLNFGKNSTSVSVGPRGAKVTKGTNGTHVSVGVPGTGVHYTKKISFPKKESQSDYSGMNGNNLNGNVPLRSKETNQLWGGVFLAFGIFLFAMAIFCPLQAVGRFIIGGIGAFCLLASVTYFTAKSIEDVQAESKKPKGKNAKGASKSQPTKEIDWFFVLFGVFLAGLCIVIFVSSFSWEWTGHSSTNIYITYDNNWMKWLLYPFLLVVSLVGLFLVYVGLAKKE